MHTHVMTRRCSSTRRAVLAVFASAAIGAFLAVVPAPLRAQDTGATAGGATAAVNAAPRTIQACYIPSSGLLYLIQEPNAPTECLGNEKHLKFTWTDGLPGNEHGALNGLTEDDHPQYLRVDPATRALIANLNAAGFKVTGLAAASAAGEAVVYQQAVKTGDAAGGDLGGTYPDPLVVQLQGQPLSNTAPATGQVLVWDGTQWAPATPASGVTDHGALNGLADDDHTQYVLADGVRNTTNGFAVTGTFGAGTIPVSGDGVRLMWYPGKAAFRAGSTVGTGWDDANIGAYSVAFGENTLASGEKSAALGSGTVASGLRSVAMGSATTASGFGAVAMGDRTLASGPGSLAQGVQTVASGSHSVAMGLGTTASQSLAVSMGRQTIATGQQSLAVGNETTASGNNSLAAGTGTLASSNQTFAVGTRTIASGGSSVAMGSHTTASGPSSLAMGQNTTASGHSSVALGRRATTDDPSGEARNGVFIFGDVDDFSQTELVRPTADNQFVVRAGGGLRLFNAHGNSLFTFESGGTGTGCRIVLGNLNCTGSINPSSDASLKTGFERVDADQVLTKLAAIPVQKWSYRADGADVRHVGPTAQDFRAAFGLGEGERTISTVDADGINMLAIQALEQRTRELRQRVAELEELRAAFATLQSDHHALEGRLEKLEAAVRQLVPLER